MATESNRTFYSGRIDQIVLAYSGEKEDQVTPMTRDTSGGHLTMIPRKDDCMMIDGVVWVVRMIVWDWDNHRVVLHLN